MSGGVVNLVGLEFFEDFFEARVVTDGADDDLKVEVGVFAEEFLLDVVGVVFVDVENNQQFRVGFGNLATEFGADRATPTRDENGFAHEVGTDFGVVDHDLVATEEIFVTQRADLGEEARCALGHGSVNRGEDFDSAFGFVTFGDDASDAVFGGGGDGDDDVFDMVFFGEAFDVFGGAFDFVSANVRSDFGFAVVDDAGDASVKFGADVVDFVDNHFASVAGADEHGAGGLFVAV